MRDHSRVRLVIATCSADYDGRLTAHLPLATRLLMVKADGSISIHADDRAYKPLNWMSPPCTLRVDSDANIWTVTNTAGERLVITIDEVLHDSSYDLGDYAEVLGGLHHLAISVPPDRWATIKARLDDLGIEYAHIDGSSIYFRDPDGARLELISDPLGEMYGNPVF